MSVHTARGELAHAAGGCFAEQRSMNSPARMSWLALLLVVSAWCVGDAQSAPIDPVSLAPQLHLRADQGVFSDAAGTVAAVNGGVVRHWADAGSANSDATNGLAANFLPTYQASGFGIHNQAAIRFDGFDDFLFQPLNLASGAKTVFAVFQSDGAVGSDSIFNFKQNGAVDASISGNIWTEAFLIQGAPTYRPISFEADYNGSASVGLNMPLDTAGHVLGFAFDGVSNSSPASYDASFDALTATVVASDIFGRNQGVGAIGRRVTSAGTAANLDLAYDGLIAELIVFNRELTAAELAGVSQFLNEKYFVQSTTNAVPEPRSLAIWSLLALGMLIAGVQHMRRRAER
jgi:hypothetical protein